MFLFGRRKRQKKIEEELSAEEYTRRFLEEHKYRMEHDEKYRKSTEDSARFFAADEEARKAAGLEDKPGEYTFTCPNCGSLCRGSWVTVPGFSYLHGGTECNTCNIHLRV